MTIEVRTPAEFLDRWTSLTMTRSIEDVAWSAELETYDRWSPIDKPIAVVEYDEITITLNDQLAFFGNVYTTTNSYDANSHTFSISARSRSAVIVDCSTPPKTWRGKTLEKIATEVLDPFGLAVIIEPSAASAAAGSFARIASEDGERVFDFLTRLAKYRGVLLTTDPVGNVIITTAERRPLQGVTIERGKGRIIEASLRRDGSKRYSEYTTKAQIPAAGLDTTEPVTISARVTDAGVPLFRPITLMPDGHEKRSALLTRAKWERNTRIAQSLEVNYTIAGWEAKKGQLWAPNDLVPVRDSIFGIATDLLVVETQFRLASDVESTQLRLVHPNAYVVAKEPVPRKKKDSEDFGFLA